MTQFSEMFAMYGAWLGVFLFGMLWGAFIVAVNDSKHNHDCHDPDGKMSAEEYQNDQILRGM